MAQARRNIRAAGARPCKAADGSDASARRAQLLQGCDFVFFVGFASKRIRDLDGREPLAILVRKQKHGNGRTALHHYRDTERAGQRLILATWPRTCVARGCAGVSGPPLQWRDGRKDQVTAKRGAPLSVKATASLTPHRVAVGDTALVHRTRCTLKNAVRRTARCPARSRGPCPAGCRRQATCARLAPSAAASAPPPPTRCEART